MTDLGLNVVSRALLLDFEEMKEKHSGGFVLVDSLRFAQGVARAVSHRAVACNFAQVVARAASHRAIACYLTQIVARAATHRATTLNLAQVVA